MADEKTRLLEAWQRLNATDKTALLRHAEALAATGGEEPAPVPQEPLDIPAPAGESAVKALKRLKRSYPMIEADARLLEDASQLLMAKMMGTPEGDVIRRLEALFAERFRTWQVARQGDR
ncbi:MAG: hypothetical protein HQL82_05470 [Magnetococcales bacterium]|nr:hypothetical protein [Magnetococcales bacterium]